MKIAITVDPEMPVPPEFYGGIERMVDMLVQEFILDGHQVTIFAHRSSTTPASLEPYSGISSTSGWDTLSNMQLITRKIYAGNFDLLHSFSRLAYLAFVLPSSIIKVMSYQRQPTISQIIKARRIAKKGSLFFTGCSDYITNQIKPYAEAFTVYNGFPMDKYEFSECVPADAPFVFLGRIEPIKGVHHAIEIALKSKRKLIIAGNVAPEHQLYFHERIAPAIDGQQIIYAGSVNDAQKIRLLKQARALLMPVEWDEPFGIVMAEAMACGTPVIALAKGAVPEIISNGITGYACHDVNECIKKATLLPLISRKAVRQEALRRFSSKVIAQNYSCLYRRLLNG